MNSATRRSLMAVAARKAQSHPADVRGSLAQGTSRYRQRLWAIHAAVVVLSALLLGAGLLTGQSADSQHEGTPPVIDSPPIDHPDPADPEPTDPADPEPPAPADPADPEPTDPDPIDPDPTDDTDDPPLVRIEFEPLSLTMVSDQTLPVKAWGIYENEAREQIPAAQLSWDVENDEEFFDVPDIASVNSDTGEVTAISAGEATLTATMQGAESPKGTADITVTDDPGPGPDPRGPTDLQDPNSGTSPDPAVP